MKMMKEWYMSLICQWNTRYFTHAALARTSIATTTLLSSSASVLFTLLLGVPLGQESINAVTIVYVVISLAGVALTTLGQTWASYDTQNGKHSLVGDLFSALSFDLYMNYVLAEVINKGGLYALGDDGIQAMEATPSRF
ncbi:hypothetical protein CK203_043458 [Vitis vinifera]|uniref:Uncharacterized protein n=1 Tax=Vitis vinifera TaxID=29760 RepID=A0A438IAQ6_VITVI|nr:hypothetical protein CK203_043458 [Vitis vinifera]